MLKIGDRVRVIGGPAVHRLGCIGEITGAQGKFYVVTFTDSTFMLCAQNELQKDNSWIGVDLDGTLAHWDGVWRGLEHIGEPIPQTIKFVQALLNRGENVKVFTARCGRPNDYEKASTPIRKWCITHIGEALMVTCEKDMYCRAIYDDIAHPVKRNEGVVL